MTIAELISSVLLEEDTASSFARELYNNVFKYNLKESSKSLGMKYVNKRYEVLKKYMLKTANDKHNLKYLETFNYNNVNSFVNEVLNWFSNNHPENLSEKQAIIDLSSYYYFKIKEIFKN